MEILQRRSYAKELLQMKLGVISAFLIAGLFTGMFMMLALNHAGPLAQPLQAIWSGAYFVGVLVSRNAHQPNGIAMAGFIFCIFFALALAVLLLIQNR